MLISQEFAYYGDRAIDIPVEFRDWQGHDICSGGRGYRRNFPDDLRDAFTTWLEPQTGEGIAGEPLDWP